jgi:hypothetical protein
MRQRYSGRMSGAMKKAARRRLAGKDGAVDYMPA